MNTHDNAIEHLINRLDDEDMLVVLKAKRLLDTGYFERDYQNAIFYPFRSKTTLADAYAFAQVHAALCKGQIAYALIEVGCEPYKDAEVGLNNAALSNLPQPFTAQFVGGKNDSDGMLFWNAPIRLDGSAVDGDERHVIMPAGEAPLEVGYTSAPTTLGHLTFERALARWSYDSRFIHLWIVTDEAWRSNLNERYD